MNARYYVPGLGRFASADTLVPDPTNPQAFNRFSYVENNPINFNDPTGHNPCPVGPNHRVCVNNFYGLTSQPAPQAQATLPPPLVSTTVSMATSAPPATPTSMPTSTPHPTPTATISPTPSGPLPSPRACLFTSCDIPIQNGYGPNDTDHNGNTHNGAIDVIPSAYRNDNAGVVGQGVNALYTGYLHFEAGDPYRAYLLPDNSNLQITYSHLDFIVGAGRVTEGQRIGNIMDITRDGYDSYSSNTPNHLHLGISTKTRPREYFDATFLLYYQPE